MGATMGPRDKPTVHDWLIGVLFVTWFFLMIWLTEGVCDRTGCNLPGDTKENTFEVDGTAADDTGLDFWLVTGPTFGCVKFEERRARK